MGPLGGSKLLGVAALSTVKFVVAPGVGWGSGLSFMETLTANVGGAWVSCALTYILAATLFERARRKRVAGEKQKRTFTRVNKFIVRIKLSRFGFFLIVGLAPTWLSVPFGTLVVTKFYGERRYALPSMMLSLFLWSVLLTSIVYGAGGTGD